MQIEKDYMVKHLCPAIRICSILKEALQNENIKFDENIKVEDSHSFLIKTKQRVFDLEQIDDLFDSVSIALKVWLKIEIKRDSMKLISDYSFNFINISFNIHY